MSSQKLLKVIKFFIFAIIVGTPLFYIKQGVFPFIISKTAFFQSLVEILLALWIVLALNDKRYRPRRTPALIALVAMLLTLVFAASLGVDPSRSFWSTYERVFGVVAILHLAAFGLVISSVFSELPWKKIFYTSLITGTAVDIIAVIQLWVPSLLLNANEGSRPGSTFDNPTFLAGYVLFNCFIGIYLLLDSLREGRQKSIFKDSYLAAAFALNVVTIFICETRGDILGLFAGIFVLILIFAFRPPPVRIKILRMKYLYGGLILCLIFFSAVFWFTRSSAVWDRVPGLGRLRTVSFASEELQPRFIALKAAWLGFLERPILGWGWDNFNVVFNKHYDPKALEISYQETRFDKPHNLFLEYLAVGGILLFLSFVVFIVTLIGEAFRAGDNLFAYVFAAAILSFLAQSFFIFDTLGPVLMFYLFFGIVDGLYKKKSAPVPAAPDARDLKVRSVFLCAALAAAFFFVYQLNVLTVKASYYEFLAFNDFVQSKELKGIEDFKKSIAVWSPYAWNFARDYVAEVAQTYFYNPGIIPNDEVWLALRAMEKVRDEHPLDAYNHYALVDMYNQTSDLDPGKLLSSAEREAAIALEQSPDRQEVYFSLAKTKSLEGDNNAAIDLVKHAIELAPGVPDGHFYYGVLAFANKDSDTGYKELKMAIDLGRKWKNFYEPRVVAGFFADYGHLSEAIELYKTALKMQPGDLETEIKLGVAYFFNNQKDEARDLLRGAAAHFDFTKSSAYGELKPILDELHVY
jgi:O-antigen ligase/tetratricopeptide (TPR) repeat protein